MHVHGRGSRGRGKEERQSSATRFILLASHATLSDSSLLTSSSPLAQVRRIIYYDAMTMAHADGQYSLDEHLRAGKASDMLGLTETEHDGEHVEHGL